MGSHRRDEDSEERRDRNREPRHQRCRSGTDRDRDQARKEKAALYDDVQDKKKHRAKKCQRFDDGDGQDSTHSERDGHRDRASDREYSRHRGKGSAGSRNGMGSTGSRNDRGSTGSRNDRGSTGSRNDRGSTGSRNDRGSAAGRVDRAPDGACGRSRRRSLSSSPDLPSSKHRRRGTDRSGSQTYSEARERACIAEYLDSAQCLLVRGTAEYDDFWKFHAMYTRKLAAAVSGAAAAAPPPEAVGAGADPFPLPAFRSELCNPLRVERRIRDKRDARELERHEREQREPELVRARQVLAAYLHFLQKQKFARLKKLRDAQRNLPIYQHREDILAAVRDNSVVIVAGDTGCGKSTQLPQYLMQAGYRNIACTQPRRIACVALCERLREETLRPSGDQIGYQVRFEARRGAGTRVLFLTEGLLLRQVSADPLLQQYDVVVLDEVHERHLQGDLLLGVLKCLVLQRPTLRLILMSATINLQLFSDYFRGRAPVIQVPGRLFPIELLYRPITAEEAVASGGRLNPAPFVRVLGLVDARYSKEERGDLLIFVSGAAEISAVADACAEYAQQNGGWLVLPLHSGLAAAQQQKVFALPPDGVRKCIVATNIAETSVTIDGVRFVLDSGKVKEMSYDAVTRMQRLKEFWVSQASAEQRKGRAGRTGPGVCFRLFSEAEYSMLAPYAVPEVQRVPLESLVLQTAALGLPDPRRFPFLDRPPEDGLEHAVTSLVQQGALTRRERLTPLGALLAQLPVDVPLAKMLVLGSVLHQMGPTLSVAAALSVQSPLTNRAFRDPDCLAALRQLHSSHGDPLSLLAVLVAWLEYRSGGRGRSRSWCWERGIEEQRLFELTKLRRQFLSIMEGARLLPPAPRLSTAADRVRRHGERAQLRAARRQLQQQQPRRQRLSAGSCGPEIDQRPPSDADDAADIDFQLRVDAAELKSLLRDSKITSYQDQALLKVILCSGLYPNFALPDLHNSYKSGADMVFHTPRRPFVVLHPNSVLAFSPEVLQVADSDVSVTSHGRRQRHSACSNVHQMLAFVSLLETNKPYVMGVTRVPALQTALLFSNRIDTDITCGTLCCDQWVEFVAREPAETQQMLARCLTLRQWWSRLLRIRLSGLDSDDVQESTQSDESAIRARLATGLVEYLHTDVHYSYRRLLPADLSGIYADGLEEPAEEDEEGASEEAEDGALPRYLHYNTLVTCEAAVPPEEEPCGHCGQPLSGLPLDRVRHWRRCIYENRTKPGESGQAGSAAAGDGCEDCGESLAGLTPLQLLRHRRSHGRQQAAN